MTREELIGINAGIVKRLLIMYWFIHQMLL
jgi:hypothetical protein